MECEGDFTQEQAEQLQGLNILQSQGMHYAEKGCHKFVMARLTIPRLWWRPGSDGGYGAKLCSENSEGK
jgi:hypothetical protein